MKKDRMKAPSSGLDPITFCGETSSIPSFGIPLEIEYPTYVIRWFKDGTYGIVKFKRSGCMGGGSFPELCSGGDSGSDSKLDNSYSRARRMVKEYGLCNDWTYFVTMTLSPEKYDRHDLPTFKADLMQWIRDERKRYSKLYGDVEKLNCLLIPQAHKDGAWHIHGFISGLPSAETVSFDDMAQTQAVPRRLLNRGFLNWPRYGNKFGFVSLGLINDQYSAVIYALRYIMRDFGGEEKGSHLYMASRPLKKATVAANVYGGNCDLDKLLTWEGRFCSTGMMLNEDWTFPLVYDNACVYEHFPLYISSDDFIGEAEPLKPDGFFNPFYIDADYEQIEIGEWLNESYAV